MQFVLLRRAGEDDASDHVGRASEAGTAGARGRYELDYWVTSFGEALGQRRADAVKYAMTLSGAREVQIEAVSLGEADEQAIRNVFWLAAIPAAIAVAVLIFVVREAPRAEGGGKERRQRR